MNGLLFYRALAMAINIDGADEEQLMTNNFTFKRTGRGAPEKCSSQVLKRNRVLKIDLYNNISGIAIVGFPCNSKSF